MANEVSLGPDALTVTFTRQTAWAAIMHNLIVPYRHITGVEVGPAERIPIWARRVGFSNPFNGARGGRFWTSGKKIAASYGDPSRVLTINLDDHPERPGGFDSVRIQTDQPEEIARQIRALLHENAT